MIVTIDGPAGSGKSTVARLLAQKLNASFLDTGAMYRAVTLASMQDGADLNNEAQLLEVTGAHDFRFSAKTGKMMVSIDGIDVTERIRNPRVTANARYIASSPKIREKLVLMQRQFAAAHQNIVTEGRDQGTVAFADADIKFFLTAEPAERARRRHAELRDKDDSSLEQIQRDIEERDNSDRSRTVGPLKPAGNAIVVDTTNLSIEQVVNKLLKFVKEKCSQKK